MPQEKPSSENNSPLGPDPSEDSVKIKAHKLLILRTLQENRCPLSLAIAGFKGTFVSIVLAVDAKNEWFELDELADPDAHLALLEKRNYQANGWLKGLNTDFTANIIGHRKHEGLIRYRSSLPRTIYQNQRRASYRTPVSMMSAPNVHLILHDNQVIKGQISNISANGALLSVPAGSPIAPGDRIAQCIFKTRNNKMIIVEAEVKRQIDAESSSRTRLGCRFTNVDLSTAQEIQRYTAAIERLNARRR